MVAGREAKEYRLHISHGRLWLLLLERVGRRLFVPLGEVRWNCFTGGVAVHRVLSLVAQDAAVRAGAVRLHIALCGKSQQGRLLLSNRACQYIQDNCLSSHRDGRLDAALP